MLTYFSPTHDAVIPSVQRVGKTARENAGFRGPVRTCIEEEIILATPLRGEVRNYATVECASDGKLLTWRCLSGGCEWGYSHSYDASGRMTKITSTKADKPDVESVFTYDGAGRLLSVTNSPNKDCRLDFQYDAEGRKSAIQIFASETILRGEKTMVAGSGLRAAILGIGVPRQGSVRTIYSDQNQAVETQVLGAAGQLVTRFVCTYDADGRILEEESIFENPAQLLLPRMLAQKNAPSLTPEQIQQTEQQINSKYEQFNSTFDFRHSLTSYTYDAQGRTTTIKRNSGVTEILYNDHGDHIEYRERRAVTRWTYRYDGRGNWTQQETISRFDHPDERETVPMRINRTLEYY